MTRTAGTSTAGTSAAGTSTAGTSTAGTSTAGSSAGPSGRASRRAPRRRPGSAAARVPAAARPVARVAVDVPLQHLDKLFDYLIPETLTEAAVPGCRVRVRFAGRLTSGFLVERAEETQHQGKLAFLERVVSPEPVLSAEIAGLARAVADRYGGTLADVLRLAIPPRHGRAETAAPVPGPGPATPDIPGPGEPRDVPGPGNAEPEASGPGESAPDAPVTAGLPAAVRPDLWARYTAGPEFLAALADGRSPRAVWAALPGPHWPAEIAAAVAATARSGRGALVIVPDARDLDRVGAALAGALGASRHLVLSAQLGPAERYRRWLAVLRGQVRVVAGTRSAAFAPVADLGLVVIWDDGDDLHAEPRAPYPHAREVLLLRAHRTGAAALIGGFARTAEAEHVLATGWAKPLAAARPVVRGYAPMVRTAGEDAELARDEAARSARMPSLALRTAREALADGPVLIQVPRRGYLASVACQQCGTRVRCARCRGPVALPGPGQQPRCGWCGTPAGRRCATCGGTVLRAVVTGERRTAEELARAFPGVAVRTSSGAGVLASVPATPALVIATPGAEPVADEGYAAAVLLDAWALLARPSLRAAEEALRRWLNAAALVRPGPAGGRVVLMAEPALPAVQALIRWDPATHAARELAERDELGFPPAVRMAAVTGPAAATGELRTLVPLPPSAEILGPVPAARAEAGQDQDPDSAGELVRYLVRSPSSDGLALAAALRSWLAGRSARKAGGQVRLQVDPAELI